MVPSLDFSIILPNFDLNLDADFEEILGETFLTTSGGEEPAFEVINRTIFDPMGVYLPPFGDFENISILKKLKFISILPFVAFLVPLQDLIYQNC